MIKISKAKSVFVCNSCGYESGKWLGKCPACNEWNTFFEQKLETSVISKKKEKENIKSIPLQNVEYKEISRLSTGFGELDRVLGGGLVDGSLILIGGEPGIGKSTLILQICDKIKTEKTVLYVSGEESAEQIKLRADRLKINKNNIMFYGETDIDLIESEVDEKKPELVIIDSIQTIFSDKVDSIPGSTGQLREITSRIMRMCKEKKVTTIIIGHVTKDGNIAGPRVLEHMVDVVLYLEGERYFSYRILRGVKNRFGSTNEIGMFEMEGEGMKEIVNPSEILISERDENPAGSVIVASMEGTRPILVELQALTTLSVFGFPRRTANGIDYNRLTLLMAVIEKRAGISLSNQDAYLNVVGGIRINEPGIDLGIVLSVCSSYKNMPISNDVVVIGEVRINRRGKTCKFN